MTKSFQAAVLMFVCVLFVSRPTVADEISIASDDYAQMTAETREKLVAEMKKQGLLAESDSVTNSVAPQEKQGLGPAVLLTLVPGACKVIAEKKKQDELAKCAAKKEPGAQEQCTSEVGSKFGTIETVCNAIKLL